MLKNINLQKLITISLIFFASTNLFLHETKAITVITIAQAGIDKSITREDLNFNLPKKIVIVPISTPNTELNLNDDELFRGIFYYTVNNLGFSDIPFHAVVSESGKIFAGNSGGDERKIRITGLEENLLVVGYIQKGISTRFDSRAEKAFSDLLTELCNRNSINPNNIITSGVKFVRNQSSLTVTLEKDSLFGSWNTSLNKIKTVVKNNFDPKVRKVKAEITAVTQTNAKVTPGDKVKVSIKVKNTSTFGIYGGTDSELILSRVDKGVSKFFLNNVWISTSQIAVMKDSEVLQPGQESTFNFEIKAPLYVGVQTEKFELKSFSGGKVTSKTVTLKLDMKRPSKPIVEIKNTPTGALNVREEPSSVGREISQVSPGERFFQIGDAGNGWIQIQLNDGTKGWVAGWFVNYI